MEKNVLNTDLSGKVAVVTGASGTLCSIFAKALARAGAKVALLGRNMEKLKELANAIEAEGGVAKGYTCNVMNKANCLQVAEEVMADLGPCDILVNGAGGNNPRANTDKEFFEMADLDDDTVTFFDLDESGVEMVFNLNFIGTLLPTQAFARLAKGKTVLMIAHRLSTVANADCIYVVQDGQIAESGTKDELCAQNGLFARMWQDYQASVQWKVAKEGKE